MVRGSERLPRGVVLVTTNSKKGIFTTEGAEDTEKRDKCLFSFLRKAGFANRIVCAYVSERARRLRVEGMVGRKTGSMV